jgi:hypothetical protein
LLARHRFGTRIIFSDRRILASSRACRHASGKMTGLWVVKTWSRTAGSAETIRKLHLGASLIVVAYWCELGRNVPRGAVNYHTRMDGPGDRWLVDEVCRESPREAHQHDGRGYHGNQVNGPRVLAFTHKVDVPRVAFVSIYVKVHSSSLHLRSGPPSSLRRISPLGPLINFALEGDPPRALRCT